MSNIYETLQIHLTPSFMEKAADYLGTKTAVVTAASSATISGILYSLTMSDKHNRPIIENALKRAAREYDEIKDSLPQIFRGEADEKIYYAGSRLLDALFDTKINTFTSLIAQETGLTIYSTDRLISMIAPLISGYIGTSLTLQKKNLATVIKEIESEKDSFIGYVPKQVSELLEITENYRYENKIDPIVQNTIDSDEISSEKQKFGWLIFLIIIILGTTLFFGWKACTSQKNHFQDQTQSTYYNESHQKSSSSLS